MVPLTSKALQRTVRASAGFFTISDAPQVALGGQPKSDRAAA